MGRGLLAIGLATWIAGCGGAAFTEGIDDSALCLGGLACGDGGLGSFGDAAAPIDAATSNITDVGVPLDAPADVVVEASPADAPHDAAADTVTWDAPPTCTPKAASMDNQCPQGLGFFDFQSPTQYCLLSGNQSSKMTTPPECQCVETYTCACLAAYYLNSGCGAGHTATCTLTQTQAPVVSCSP